MRCERKCHFIFFSNVTPLTEKVKGFYLRGVRRHVLRAYPFDVRNVLREQSDPESRKYERPFSRRPKLLQALKPGNSPKSYHESGAVHGKAVTDLTGRNVSSTPQPHRGEPVRRDVFNRVWLPPWDRNARGIAVAAAVTSPSR